MKREVFTTGKLLNTYRVLLLILMFLILLLACGTLYAMLRSPKAGPIFRIGRAGKISTIPAVNSAVLNEESNVFNGIGRLRIPLVNENLASVTLIISIAFPYPPGDRSFTEELASKITNFRQITNDYFSALPPSSYMNLNMDDAKTELLKRYNAVLRLGKIGTLFFTDFMILEAESQD
jgi:flagellar basal body-associated protein FliL